MIIMRNKHYVVEVNEGVYLTELLNGYRFTNDIKKASLYESRYESWKTAKECGGTDKQYVITHEVIPFNT
ncbi:hypothetical protein [Staphylococcus succinus]|uniref:hypothetical protein n=1 Tax=Staphylococcus succinus TaxID=61015 RepID=UPI001C042DCF|nr:hypothetical protein [Staphylococcus succinus]MBU0437020.1 hypothetical protein [Staphylococcus succinus]